MEKEQSIEQLKDTEQRIQKTVDFLKENELELAAMIRKVNVGKDMFVDQITPFLKDLKYKPKEPIESPYGKEDPDTKTKESS